MGGPLFPAHADGLSPPPSAFPPSHQAIEPIPADFAPAKRTWLALRAGASPADVGAAVVAHLRTKGATAVTKARLDEAAAAAGATPVRVKLLVAFPATHDGGALAWALKLLDAAGVAGQPGSGVPAGAGLVADVTKTGGDLLGSLREFDALAGALRAAGLLVERGVASAGAAPAAQAAAAPEFPYSVLPARGSSVLASDLLRIL